MSFIDKMPLTLQVNYIENILLMKLTGLCDYHFISSNYKIQWIKTFELIRE